MDDATESDREEMSRSKYPFSVVTDGFTDAVMSKKEVKGPESLARPRGLIPLS
jgi:hypothetical protein